MTRDKDLPVYRPEGLGHENHCGWCAYWEKSALADTAKPGTCRRYPPALSGAGGWPKTDPMDWCGEFRSYV